MIPHKNERNLRERGLSFELVNGIRIRNRANRTGRSPELRRGTLPRIGVHPERLHALVYTLPEDKLRVISLRRANVREISEYEKTTESGEG